MKRTYKVLPLLLTSILVLLCFAPMAQAAPDTTIKVSVMVIGDSRHASGAHSQYQIWVDKAAYTMPDGAKAADLIFQALDDNGLDYDYTSSLFGEYIAAISAPAILGGYLLSEGPAGNGNGSGSGWMVSSSAPGTSDQVLLEKGIGQHDLSDGEFVVVRYVDDYTEVDWTSPHLPSSWLKAAALPTDDSGDDSSDDSGSGGGGGSGRGTTQAESATPKEYGFSDLKSLPGSNTYQITAEKDAVIKAGAFSGLPQGSVLYVDAVANGRVQFRLRLPSPAEIKTDLKAGMGFAPETNAVKKLFGEYFQNKLFVFAFEHAADFGQVADIMIYADNIGGFDRAAWKLYSYDPDKNIYTELPYRMGLDQYIRFSVPNGNPVIFSDGALLRK